MLEKVPLLHIMEIIRLQAIQRGLRDKVVAKIDRTGNAPERPIFLHLNYKMVILYLRVGAKLLFFISLSETINSL